MADPRGLHALLGSHPTADCHGVLLHNHLLGDLARYEASISYDVAARVSPRKNNIVFLRKLAPQGAINFTRHTFYTNEHE